MKYKRIRWLLLLLVTALVGRAQTTTPLTDNGDGTWTLAVMPDYNVKLVMEYEDASLPAITTQPVAKIGLVYNGQAQELINAGAANGGEMSYSLDGVNFSADLPTATSAGTYTVYYKAASTTLNCGDTPVQTLTAEIAQLTDFTNNGDGTWTLAAMPDYDVKLVVEYGDLVSVLTDPVVKKVLVYNGNQQELITAGTADGGVMKYSLDNENFSTDIPTATQPGFYTIYYKVESTTPGFGDTSVLTLTARIAPQVDFTDNGEGTWSMVVTPGNYTTLESMPYNEVKLVVEYEDASLPAITSAPVGKTGLVYNGLAQELITAGVAEGGVMNYSLDGINFSANIPTATSSGTHTVYYKAASTTLNCGDTPMQTLTVEIAQLTDFTDNGDGTWTLAAMPDYDVKLVVVYEDATLPAITTAPAAKAGLVYNGSAQELITAGVANGGVMMYSLDGVNFSADIPTAASAGTYTVYYKAASTTPNCSDTPVQTLTAEIAQLTDFTNNGDGTWTLAAMPDYDVKLVVEYVDDVADIALADNSSNAETLNTYLGSEHMNVTLQDRTLYKDGKWNTLTLPFDVATLTGTPLAGATIMEMNTAKKNGFDASSGTLYLAFKTATGIEAGKPYLVKWESGSDIVEPVFTDVTISSTTPTAVESATSGLETVKMVGNYAPVNVEANDQSIMFMGDGSSLYYTTEDRTLRNFRAHFEIPSQQSAPALARSFVIDFDGEGGVTSIDGVRIANGGQTGGWYTIDGRRLDRKPTAKGVYIHDGAKVVIR